MTVFDLLTRPWLPVMDRHGHLRHIGLRDALTRAEDWRQLCGDHPGQQAALLRLLCAIAARAGVTDDTTPSAAARLCGHYLTQHAAGFDLLDPRRPFLQVPDLDYSTRSPRAVDTSVLTPRRGQFALDAAGPLDPGEAARGLVWLQAYAPAGITGATSGDPRQKGGRVYPIGTGWAARGTLVLLHGATLSDTIRLNLPPAQPPPATAPWEITPAGPAYVAAAPTCSHGPHVGSGSCT